MLNRVLVTGGCGFIGSHLVDDLLNKGFRVAVVDNLSSGKLDNIENSQVDFYQLDILDSSLIKVFNEFEPDYVIHLAAQGSVSASLKNFVFDADINIRGSLKVIELAKAFNVKKIIFASSAAVYGEPKHLPIGVGHELNPLSPYGLSKLTVEKYLDLIANNFGLNYTILRFSNVYGINQRTDNEGGVISIFIDNILKGFPPIIYGNGKQTRDFINVRDVSEAIIQSTFQGSRGVFNISTNKSITINEIVELISQLSDYNGPIRYESSRVGDISDSLLDNSETINVLDWYPKVDIRNGLKEVIDYEKNRLL